MKVRWKSILKYCLLLLLQLLAFSICALALWMQMIVLVTVLTAIGAIVKYAENRYPEE